MEETLECASLIEVHAIHVIKIAVKTINGRAPEWVRRAKATGPPVTGVPFHAGAAFAEIRDDVLPQLNSFCDEL